MNILKNINLLYIDDDPNIRKPFQRIYSNFFKNVTTAENGKVALEIYNSLLQSDNKIDLIVSDINMPIMDGIEFLKVLRTNNDQVSVIFLTARTETEKLINAIDLNVTNYIVKPINTEKFLEKSQYIASKILLDKQLKEKEKELKTIFEITKDGIAILDFKGNFLSFNDAYLKMTGYDDEELKAKSCLDLSLEEDIEKSLEVFNKVIEEGSIQNYEKTCLKKNGEKFYVNASLSLMPDKKRILISVKDITKKIQKQKMIENYVNLIDKNIITSSTDLLGNIISASNAFCNVCKYSKEELIGQKHNIVRHPDMPKEIFDDMWDTLTRCETWTGEIKNRAKDGTSYWVKASIYPDFDEDGNKIGYTAIRQDITDKKIIEEISITDGLTGIYNRRHFNELFPKLIKSAKREDKSLSFMIIDIDYFKQYNDTYGHQEGDRVLIKVANAIKDSLKRGDDYCFRLGGEEFGIIFKSDSKDKSIYFANHIKNNIENLQIEHKNNKASPYITISVGLAYEDANEIIYSDIFFKKADDLLYKAKEKGRNVVVF